MRSVFLIFLLTSGIFSNILAQTTTEHRGLDPDTKKQIKLIRMQARMNKVAGTTTNTSTSTTTNTNTTTQTKTTTQSSTGLSITIQQLKGYRVPAEDGCVYGDCDNGEGVYLYADGHKYAGIFVDGMLNGKGIEVNADGDVYEGEFADDFQSKGKMTYADGDVYIGDWEFDVRNGYGKMTHSDGKVEEGYWEDDEYVGKTKPKADE